MAANSISSRARTTSPGHGGLRGTPGLTVRQATTADADAVATMRLALLAEEGRSPIFAPLRSDADRLARELTMAQLAAPQQVILLALNAERAVGMLRCVIRNGSRLVSAGPHAFLTSAYVRPGWRRRGVLRALLQAADGWCRAHGLREMRLHCTVENATGNVAWKSLGFTPAQILHRRNVPGA
jgi:GNAT superfamily N-acetyltransferase